MEFGHAFAFVLFVFGAAVLRWFDVFSTSAAKEAGKKFGESVGEKILRRMERYGFTTILSASLGVFAGVAFFVVGIGLAVASPDCTTQQMGYAMSAWSAGVFAAA